MTAQKLKKTNLDYIQVIKPPINRSDSGALNIQVTMLEKHSPSCPADAPNWHVHMEIRYGGPFRLNDTICMAPGNALRLAEQLQHCGEQAYAKLVMRALDS